MEVTGTAPLGEWSAVVMGRGALDQSRKKVQMEGMESMTEEDPDQGQRSTVTGIAKSQKVYNAPDGEVEAALVKEKKKNGRERMIRRQEHRKQ